MSAEEHVPAWKRAGLKQVKKASAETYDPLQAGLKRTAQESEASSNGPKKPPKRVKVPKAERAANRGETPEPDQLLYLRQFSEDKANWKFSKQKQNWILKNLFTITEDRYDQPLIDYIAGLQGGSRRRVNEEAIQVVNKWNEFMREPDNQPEDQTDENQPQTDGEQHSEPVPEKKHSTDTKSDNNDINTKAEPKGILKNANTEPEANTKRPPSEKMARRAQAIVALISGEKPELEFIE